MITPLIIARIYIIFWIILESIFLSMGIFFLLFAIYPFDWSLLLGISSIFGLAYILVKFLKYDDREIAWMYEFSHPDLNELLITYVETGDESLGRKLSEKRLKFWKIYLPQWRVFLFFLLSLLIFIASFRWRKPLYLWKLGYVERKVDVNTDSRVYFSGETAVVSAKNHGPFDEVVRIAGRDTFRIKVEPFQETVDSIENLRRGIYRIFHGKTYMDSFVVISRPLLESLFAFVRSPYSKSVDTIANAYSLSALEESRITFRLIHSGDSVRIENMDSVLKVISDTNLRIRLFKGERSYVYPGKIQVKMLRDMPPLVRILIPEGKMLYLPRDGRIVLGAVSMDDFGLRRIEVRYRLGETGDVLLKMKPDSPVRDTFLRDLDLNSVPMLPGDEVKVVVRAVDVGGNTSSDYIVVRFPTLREQMDMSDEELARSTGDMEDVFKRVEELSENMDRAYTMSNEEIRDVVRQLRDLKEDLSRLSDRMKDLSSLAPMDEELNRLIEQLEKLYDRILDSEMEDLIRKLEKLSDSRNPDDRRKILEKIRKDMERLKESLRSTYETLNRFYQEQKLKQISRRLEELVRDQRVAIDTSDERRIRDELKSIRSSLDSLGMHIEQPFGDSISSHTGEMDSLLSDMDSVMKNSPSGRIGQGDREDLSRKMQRISRRMSRMTSSLISSRKSDIIRGLERVKEQVAFVLYNSHAESYEEQSRVVRALGLVMRDLKEILPKNFLISASIYGYLYSALQDAREALARMKFSDRKRAIQYMDWERKNLFLSLIEIQNSMNQIASASSSTGFQEMLQQMSRAAGEQSSFNNRLQMMLGRGRIPMDVLREMARQQASIRKQIEGMAENLEKMGREGRKYSRQLKEIAREMEDIEKRLRVGDVDRKLLERQRRILNRLLEAYRGMKSQKLEKKREAVRARDYKFRIPQVPEELILRRRLMEILRSYSGDRRVLRIYRQLLRSF